VVTLLVELNDQAEVVVQEGYRTSAGTSGGGGSAESQVNIDIGISYTVTVGAGGAGLYQW
jgi:hypothetical protein